MKYLSKRQMRVFFKKPEKEVTYPDQETFTIKEVIQDYQQEQQGQVMAAVQSKLNIFNDNPEFGESGIWTITPEIALEWLKRMGRNRPFRPHNYARILNGMRNKWYLNGESIKFDKNGYLRDGQHRLRAVLELGATIQSYVIFNLEPEVMPSIDIGGIRTPGDRFGLLGEVNVDHLAAAIRWVWRYESHKMINYSAKDNPIHEVLYNVLERNPELRMSLSYGSLCSKIVQRSLASALHYLCSRKDAALADTFFEQLGTGKGNFEDGKPIFMLRTRLLDNIASKAKLPPGYIAALVIKSWNAERKGKKIRSLRFRTEEPKAEEYPEIE